MMRYELLMLSVPEITQDEARSVESYVDRAIKKVKGSLLSFDRWGKYRLAYPVNKNDYGIYFLARFETEIAPELLEDLKSIFAVNLNEIVMRHMICKLDPKASLEYHKPQSLEEAPARDSFLGDNKMDRRSLDELPSDIDEEDIAMDDEE
ncbi:MAG TPA: 30S ribosomal protein S6 [Candidatus Babeliales bacterium]|nr:30S ribosomal protein S6 [Candidatus Babeliales bacterium]